MTLAPCFAASPMYLACFSIIESLSPVHEHWTNAALTVVMSRSPLSGQRMARSGPLRHPAALESVRRGRRFKEQIFGGRVQGWVTGGGPGKVFILFLTLCHMTRVLADSSNTDDTTCYWSVWG